MKYSIFGFLIIILLIKAIVIFPATYSYNGRLGLNLLDKANTSLSSFGCSSNTVFPYISEHQAGIGILTWKNKPGWYLSFLQKEENYLYTLYLGSYLQMPSFIYPQISRVYKNPLQVKFKVAQATARIGIVDQGFYTIWNLGVDQKLNYLKEVVADQPKDSLSISSSWPFFGYKTLTADILAGTYRANGYTNYISTGLSYTFNLATIKSEIRYNKIFAESNISFNKDSELQPLPDNFINLFSKETYTNFITGYITNTIHLSFWLPPGIFSTKLDIRLNSGFKPYYSAHTILNPFPNCSVQVGIQKYKQLSIYSLFKIEDHFQI